VALDDVSRDLVWERDVIEQQRLQLRREHGVDPDLAAIPLRCTHDHPDAPAGGPAAVNPTVHQLREAGWRR